MELCKAKRIWTKNYILKSFVAMIYSRGQKLNPIMVYRYFEKNIREPEKNLNIIVNIIMLSRLYYCKQQ